MKSLMRPFTYFTMLSAHYNDANQLVHGNVVIQKLNFRYNLEILRVTLTFNFCNRASQMFEKLLYFYVIIQVLYRHTDAMRLCYPSYKCFSAKHNS